MVCTTAPTTDPQYQGGKYAVSMPCGKRLHERARPGARTAGRRAARARCNFETISHKGFRFTIRPLC